MAGGLDSDANAAQLSGNFGLIRVQLKTATEVLFRTHFVSFVQIIIPKQLVGFRRFRVQPNGLVITTDRILTKALILERLTQPQRTLC